MAKYEIMLLVDGNLDEAKSKEAIKNLTELFSEQKDYKETSLGLRDLAYKINGLSKAWYTQLNFSLEDATKIAEFRRLALIDKAVIRQLVINLDKDYGANALKNPKKVKRSKVKMTKYKERMAKIAAEREAKEKQMQELKEINSLAKKEEK